MFGRSEFLRRVSRSVDVELAPGEARRAAAFLRGPGLGGVPARPGVEAGTVETDWVVVVTDRRILLFAVGDGASAAGLVDSFTLDAVRLVDATLRGPTPTLVLRFPDAVLGWFHPLPAWRAETERLVDELRRGAADDVEEAYPDENTRYRERRFP